MAGRHGQTAGWPGAAGLLLAAALALLAGCTSSSQPQQSWEVSALHHFKQGNRALEAADYRTAIEQYRRALSYDESAPELHYNLGLAYYHSAAYRKASEAWQQALALRQDFADAHLNLALAYDKLYNAEAAHQHYNRYRALVANAEAEEPQSASRPTTAQRSGAQRPDGAADGQTAARTAEEQTAAARAQHVSDLPGGRSALRARRAQQGEQAQRSQGGGSAAEGSQWWTQDRFIQNR